MRRKLAAGNWKMNGLAADLDQIDALEAAHSAVDIDILVCPPAPLLERMAARASKIVVGGQDCHASGSGAHTGDVSAEMLADVGCAYVIVGHSERRDAHKESDEDNVLMFQQLYKSCGYTTKGNCLITPTNFQVHFMIGATLSRDRTVKFHHNLQENQDFKAVLTFDSETTDNKVLVVYSVFDRIIEIDSQRNVNVI